MCDMKNKINEFDFSELVKIINNINQEFTLKAKRAINISLTLRNWIFGFYIAEYELSGKDRARYGHNLLGKLSKKLQILKISSVENRELRRYKQFYITYPQIRESLTPEFKNKIFSIQKRELEPTFMPGNTIINKLSFTHISELLKISDKTKRAFYEIESINGVWSVRELKRQIASLYYERSGLSSNKEKLSELIQKNTKTSTQHVSIQDPYIFEFLGLKPKEVMSESNLEDALLNNIEEFLLELGDGFCFEGRQKRILIGETHYFVDLVFYHRVLKCHILVELKLAEFSHENIGQLNTYVNWYKKNMMLNDDNPPIGILLCTVKDHALIEYALADMDDRVFVSKYQLALPKKEEMQKYIEKKLREKKLS